MIARLRARYAAWAEAHPKAASSIRHGVVTFLAAFGLFVLPVVDDVLNGGPVDVEALKAAVLAGGAAGLRAVGLWLRSRIPA